MRDWSKDIVTLLVACIVSGQTGTTSVAQDPDPSVARRIINTLAGNDWMFPPTGQRPDAPLSSIASLASDSEGNLYVSDWLNQVVLRMSATGAFRVIAGNSLNGFSGDGGQATHASLNWPCGVAVDHRGNVYITDRHNHRIRRVSPAGIISTYAGNGHEGFSGDGGPATAAMLSLPCHAAVDSQGNVYFFDAGNSRVRRISPEGIITTLVGTGENATAASADGLAVSPDDVLYFASARDKRIWRVHCHAIASTTSLSYMPTHER